MIQDRFKNLYLDVGTRLQQTFTAEEIKDGLQPFAVTLFPEREESIPKSSNPMEIFEAISNSQLWDYSNYVPLEQITKQFGKNDPAMTSVMEEYKKDILKVTSSTVSYHGVWYIVPYVGMAWKKWPHVQNFNDMFKSLLYS